MIDAITAYWNERIHDLEMTDQPVGTLGFFDDLDEHRFDKLRHLSRLVDFAGHRDRRLLEVGCGHWHRPGRSAVDHTDAGPR